MALKPLNPGLRQFHNKSNDVAKVSLVIPAGDGIAVSEYVAAQLGPAFIEGEVPAPVVESAEEPATPAKRTRKS